MIRVRPYLARVPDVPVVGNHPDGAFRLTVFFG